MFGFKKKLTNAINSDANNFMSSLNKISEVKEKASVTIESSNQSYENIFNDALESFKSFIFSDGDDEGSLRKATSGFVKASELKPSKPEAYYYLAILFHLFGENETALKYLKAVEIINPEFEELSQLKLDISNSFLNSNTTKQNESNVPIEVKNDSTPIIGKNLVPVNNSITRKPAVTIPIRRTQAIKKK